MNIRFQADEDLDARIIRGIRRVAPEVDIQTASEGGLLGLGDPEVLRAAVASGRILVSQDRRTMPRHFRHFVSHSQSTGVILLREGVSIIEVVDQLVLIWAVSSGDEWTNRLIWIPL
ncbi:MAG: DUF5615 family PIN-like protein [Acidobacteriota bacterium]